jgi:hypothetical protein
MATDCSAGDPDSHQNGLRQSLDWPQTDTRMATHMVPAASYNGAPDWLATDCWPQSGAPPGAHSAGLGQCDLGFGLQDLGFKGLPPRTDGLVREGDLSHLFMSRTRPANK